MSRSEYRQRQRQQGMSDAHTLDGGEDASTLGFSLGSVQSAPALGGLGLGLDGSGGGGVEEGGEWCLATAAAVAVAVERGAGAAGLALLRSKT